MSVIDTSYMAEAYIRFLKSQGMGDSQAEDTTFLEKMEERSRASRQESESVVAQYKIRHPEQAATVDAQVQAGKAVRSKYGLDNICTEKMTMAEYKNLINGLLSRIPFDATRIYDKEIISISEAGWEQMKKDPDYEAWVLGYTVQNRSVRNPFFGWPGASGTVYVEKFGASIEEHCGQSIGSTGPRRSCSTNGKKKKSWWDKRQERMKELMEEQVEKARIKAQVQRKLEQENYYNSLLASQQRLHLFLDSDGMDTTELQDYQPIDASSLAEAYVNTLNIISLIKKRGIVSVGT